MGCQFGFPGLEFFSGNPNLKHGCWIRKNTFTENPAVPGRPVDKGWLD